MADKSKEYGAEGGKARAANLTKAELSDIGRQGALKRWTNAGKGPTHRAIREAVLRIGNIEFECAVLDDETRVLSERAFSRAIGAKRGGSHWKRMKADPTGAKLPVFLSANNLRPFISNDLAVALSEPIPYLTGSGQWANGINAELIPKILDVWLLAEDACVLTKPQRPFAIMARLLLRGFATTGLIALIDEATGHQQFRGTNALAKYLEKYIAKELRQWVSTFPRSFFEHLCRLRGIDLPEDMRLPRYIGHDINFLVWDRLGPGIKNELQKKNPAENGRRRHKHHQWLTEQIGNPRLLHHLGRLEGMAEDFGRGEWDAFKAKVIRVLPNYSALPLFAVALEEGEAGDEKRLISSSASSEPEPGAPTAQ